MHLYIWPLNSFPLLVHLIAVFPCWYLHRITCIWRFLKESNKRRRPKIYVCVFPHQSPLQPPTTYVLSTRQAYIVLIQVRSFGTRGNPYNSPLNFIYHFTLSVDRRRRHRLSWLWHYHNDCDDTAEIVAAICTVSRRNTVVHRLLWGRWVLADRRLRSYLNEIHWEFSRQR